MRGKLVQIGFRSEENRHDRRYGEAKNYLVIHTVILNDCKIAVKQIAHNFLIEFSGSGVKWSLLIYCLAFE